MMKSLRIITAIVVLLAGITVVLINISGEEERPLIIQNHVNHQAEEKPLIIKDNLNQQASDSELQDGSVPAFWIVTLIVIIIIAPTIIWVRKKKINLFNNIFLMRKGKMENLLLEIAKPSIESGDEKALKIIYRNRRRAIPCLVETLKDKTFNTDRWVEYSDVSAEVLLLLAKMNKYSEKLVIKYLINACRKNKLNEYRRNPGHLLIAIGEPAKEYMRNILKRLPKDSQEFRNIAQFL